MIDFKFLALNKNTFQLCLFIFQFYFLFFYHKVWPIIIVFKHESHQYRFLLSDLLCRFILSMSRNNLCNCFFFSFFFTKLSVNDDCSIGIVIHKNFGVFWSLFACTFSLPTIKVFSCHHRLRSISL